jgi:hypothetical protein
MLQCDVATKCWTASCSSSGAERVPCPESPGGELQLETIVMRTGRPVLAIKRDEAQLTFDDADSAVWKSRLTAARPAPGGSARAVAGSKWRATALRGSDGLVRRPRDHRDQSARGCRVRSPRRNEVRFRMGLDGHAMRASIDLLEEVDC